MPKPKPITKTTVKLSITHDRLAIKVSYVNGEVLKMSSSRSSARIATERPVSFTGVEPTSKDLQILLNSIDKAPPGENNGQMFERVARVLEGTSSIVDAASVIQGHHAQVMMAAKA